MISPVAVPSSLHTEMERTLDLERERAYAEGRPARYRGSLVRRAWLGPRRVGHEVWARAMRITWGQWARAARAALRWRRW